MEQLRRSRFSIFALALALIWLATRAPTARAWTEGALKVADPFSFAPSELSERDFKIQGPVLWEWVEGSFEWVRVDRKFVLPRAKVRLTVPATAKVTYQKQTYLPSPEGKVEVLIVLSQERAGEARNEILIEDFTTRQRSRAAIVFKPQDFKTRISLDPSCSPYKLQLSGVELSRSWVFVYCKAIHPQTDGTKAMKLDVDLYWEMEGSPETLFVNNKPVVLDDALTASFSLDAHTSKLAFRRGGGERPEQFDLEAHLPEKFRAFGMSLGLGPYSHQEVLRPFTTVYASYFFNDAFKLAAFGALPIRRSPEIDLGLYLVAEQARVFDDRIWFNLLLGFHTLSYVPHGDRVFAFSAPQGVELVFRDFLARGQHFMVGGFFYPEIDRRYYVNSWVRWGSSTFVELNFIRWQEPVTATETFGAKSFGLSIGFPLFRAW